MRRPLIGALLVGATLLTGTTVLAQGVITDVKTPPLQASDTFILPIDIHNGGPVSGAPVNPPWAGWAGGRMKMHILDAGEMDVVSLTPVAGGVATAPPIVSPFGPASANVASSPIFFTSWHPLAAQSGIDIVASVNQPLFDLEIHVKNSDPAGNSDIDATFMFWNIWHTRPTPGSTTFGLGTSSYILVRSTIDNIDQLHIPQNPQGTNPLGSFYQFPSNPATPNDPNAHWLHISNVATWHLPTGQEGSQYYATFLNTATLGIEHVPEPASALLLLVGVATAMTGVWFRRRRKAA